MEKRNDRHFAGGRDERTPGGFELSIVVPVLDHGEGIGLMLARLRTVVRDLQRRTEIVIADDGCRELVGQVAPRWRAQFDGLVVVRHDDSRGLGAAVRTGVLVARGEGIVVVDPDLDLSLANVAIVVEGLDSGADVVLIARPAREGGAHDSRSFLERAASTTVMKLSQLVLPVGVRDVFTGLRGMRGRAAKKIAQRARVRGAAYGAEWVALAQWLGFQVVEYSAQGEGGPPPVRRPASSSSFAALRDLWQTRQRFAGTAYDAAAHPGELLHDTSFVKLDRAALLRGVSDRRRI